jgi:HK97 family phage portal protein
MGYLHLWPFNKFVNEKIEKKTNTTKRTFRLSDFLDYMQTKGWYKVTASLAMQLYEKNSAVADSVDTIKDNAKTIKPLIKRGDVYVDDHDILTLLKNPNKMQNYPEFIESCIIYKLLTGNLFISAFGNVNVKDVPTQLYVTPTDTIVAQGEGLSHRFQVFPQPALQYLEKEYIFDKKTGRYLANTLAEMFFINNFINYTTTNGYVANSILNSILYEIEVLNSGNNHNLSMLLNGVNLSGVFSIDTEDQDVVDQFILDARNYFAGSANAGKYIASKGKGIEFKPIQSTNKEMEALGNSEAVRKVIYDRFQIPSPLRSLGTETYSNYETARLVLFDMAVIPCVNSIFSGLTAGFRRRSILKDNEEITYDPNSIPALQTRFIEEIKNKKETGVYANNEIREMFGSDPLGPENDILYQNYNMVPVGSSIPDVSQQVDDDAKKRFANILKNAGFTDEQIKERVSKYYDTID